MTNSPVRTEAKVEIDMTPMIDIVFQLLVFFIMTLNIVAPEGDFSIKMPLLAGKGDVEALSPTVVLAMTADERGALSSMRLGEAAVQGFDALRARVVGMVNHAGGPGRADLEIELDCADGLHYDYVVKALTAVSGRVDAARGGIEPLVGKVKVTAPKKK